MAWLQTERTPLHIAAANQHADVVRELLLINAPHDAKDNTGNVPLHTAVQVRCCPPEIVSLVTVRCM